MEGSLNFNIHPYSLLLIYPSLNEQFHNQICLLVVKDFEFCTFAATYMQIHFPWLSNSFKQIRFLYGCLWFYPRFWNTFENFSGKNPSSWPLCPRPIQDTYLWHPSRRGLWSISVWVPLILSQIFLTPFEILAGRTLLPDPCALVLYKKHTYDTQVVGAYDGRFDVGDPGQLVD